MKILLFDIEKGYAACKHDYNQEEDDNFMKLLAKFEAIPDGEIRFQSYEELYFDGMTDDDKTIFINTIKKYIYE
ncbi:hypothetical protein [Enterococcus dispar]|uniref:hypothetical protein n=1 Tax=Enterococcus dispar TaxID=44009 RepID=UPI002490F4B7|nr:hypothetical protein [Enterococcus dispar]